MLFQISMLQSISYDTKSLKLIENYFWNPRLFLVFFIIWISALQKSLKLIENYFWNPRLFLVFFIIWISALQKSLKLIENHFWNPRLFLVFFIIWISALQKYYSSISRPHGKIDLSSMVSEWSLNHRNWLKLIFETKCCSLYFFIVWISTLQNITRV